jgi:hypothetical protein
LNFYTGKSDSCFSLKHFVTHYRRVYYLVFKDQVTSFSSLRQIRHSILTLLFRQQLFSTFFLHLLFAAKEEVFLRLSYSAVNIFFSTCSFLLRLNSFLPNRRMFIANTLLLVNAFIVRIVTSCNDCGATFHVPTNHAKFATVKLSVPDLYQQ